MKSRLILYIAMSLDGYIAEADGSIGFLEEAPSPSPDLGYEEFYNSIQAIILGGKTYRQVKKDLSPERWPYEGVPCYVCTRQQNQYDPNVHFTSLPPGQQVLDLVSKECSGNIWLMGGGEIIRCFMRENLIDQYYIYVMPTVLGDGIPLFPAGFPKTNLKLEGCKNIGEIVELMYQKRPPED
ncbi:MAG: dihydrofolate reductase [Oscillospiraceae bacterium]|nr:dihydrofolate reductase [Oscillospiraceae bacterium]